MVVALMESALLLLVMMYVENMDALGIVCNCVECQEKGPHIFQTCPSANYYDCKAMAIGARSQVGLHCNCLCLSCLVEVCDHVVFSCNVIFSFSLGKLIWRGSLLNFLIVS